MRGIKGDLYQIILILLGIIATLLFGVFVLREAFPEYKIYQKDYIALEEFRSTYTKSAPPPFQIGIRQIVQEREDKGPAKIDRCTSCHVALDLPHFSPTKVAIDANGNIIYDENGIPKKVKNEEDVWFKLDEEILKLEKENRFSESNQLKALKTADIHGDIIDVTKVLRMHPLIGAETRAFEFHPVDEYGCTICHNGNGLGLTAAKAHGPIEDGQYEVEFEGPVPKFLEQDKLNDPAFATKYNGKPGGELLFQTSPILVGALIQAKCLQCHESTASALQTLNTHTSIITNVTDLQYATLQKSFNNDQASLLSLVNLHNQVSERDVDQTILSLKKQLEDYSLSDKERVKLQSNIDFLLMLVGGEDGLRQQNRDTAKDVVLKNLKTQMVQMIGSVSLTDELLAKLSTVAKSDQGKIISEFLLAYQNDIQATGFIFKKLKSLEEKRKSNAEVQDTKNNLNKTADDLHAIKHLSTNIDLLTSNYQRGQNLYISQGCYACHRILGFARGGVGPELTEIGKGYPWYIKQKMVWPQSTLKTSTMPNYHLDHTELEDLMTFLLGQTGKNQSISENVNKIRIKEWEGGEKLKFEKPLTPTEIHDLNFSMTVFATEGCAACHRLKGFQSDVGFTVEKKEVDFKTLYEEKEWFKNLVPEMIKGSSLVKVLENHAKEIDQRIAKDVRLDSILEKIEEKSPHTIESFYPDFSFAMRAKNHEFEEKLINEKDSVKKESILKELRSWKARVRRVLMIYIQEYGLGRIVAPKLNWSGVYRSDEWIMQHFKNPSALAPGSIMPIFPFDDTKFYALTLMLNTLGKKNRDSTKEIWDHFGFDPKTAYNLFCSQCHGDQLSGNGPVAEWIYPIPKNLRNAEFLRNLTKENDIHSIIHGVKGTPMAPWGEAFDESSKEKQGGDGKPVLSRPEANALADWMFSMLPGERVIEGSKNVPKWQYRTENIAEELKNEGNVFKGSENVTENDPIFEIHENESGTFEKKSYYIKRKYYTEENIEAGKQFFEMNCAVCHGKDADGTGPRGAIMQDAKPRKLTNLEWLNTRDDLRLLRSIKYGVAGTAMNPWGDLTSSLQRLQLVVFIRSLNDEPERRNTLSTSLYSAFDESILLIENARVKEFTKIDMLQNELNKLNKLNKDDTEAIENFKKQLKTKQELDHLKSKDQLFKTLQTYVKEDKAIFNQIGQDFIARQVSPSLFNDIIALINLNKGRYTYTDGKLILSNTENFKKMISLKEKELVKGLDEKIASLKTEKQKDVETEEKDLNFIESEIKGYEKLKISLISGLKKVFDNMQAEEKVLNDYAI